MLQKTLNRTKSQQLGLTLMAQCTKNDKSVNSVFC